MVKKGKIVYNRKEFLRKDNIKMNKEINVGITIKNIRKAKMWNLIFYVKSN